MSLPVQVFYHADTDIDYLGSCERYSIEYEIGYSFVSRFMKMLPYQYMATHSSADYELLRRRCAALKDQNWSQVKIAQALGLTENWVSQTLKKYRQDGLQALTWKKPAGPSCRLIQEQLAQIVTELNKGALAHGFEGRVWTRQ